MARVKLMGPLRTLAGVDTVDVDAHNIRSLLARLTEQVPALGPSIETGVAVAIDGQIYQDMLLQEIGPDSEVHVLPQIAGG